MSIEQQLTRAYVGEFVQLIEIDTTPIGGSSILRFTPSDNLPIIFRSQEYTPAVLQIQGTGQDGVAAPFRPKLNIAYTHAFASLMISMGDLIGARLLYHKTLSDYVSSGEVISTDEYTIFRKDSFSRNGIGFTLAAVSDKPYIYLPGRQILKDPSPYGLHCPAILRWKL